MRGVIFSMDAIVAVSAILVLLGTWAYVSNVNDKHTLKFADLNSNDASTIGLYLNENGYGTSAKEFACNSYVKYSEAAFTKKEFCEGLK